MSPMQFPRRFPWLIALGPLPRPRGPGSCLLSLHLQPLEFSGLQRRPGRGIAHRFGRKMENLKEMIALRGLRAKLGWEDYWSNAHQEAA